MQGFMGRYLDQSVQSFVQQQQAMQSQISKMMSGTPFAPLAEITQQNLAMWQQMQESFVAALRPKASSPPHSGADVPEEEPESVAAAKASKKA